uniref:NuBaID C-terminal domain-containing protein n=1 Tax=Timema shepardi TaxID=629360 RepID=A0A7R9B354_TIMSH|nr:unnamed protein product [Timema shepardi]
MYKTKLSSAHEAVNLLFVVQVIALEHGALQLIVKNILKVPLTEESMSALVLALCGWGPTTSHNVLSCDFCKRQVGLWNFITIQDEPTLADDYLCILNSPGSCSDEPLSVLESSPIQDVDMQLDGSQVAEGSEPHEDASEKEESSFIGEQYDYDHEYGHYDENQDSCDDANEGSVEQYAIENNDEENLDSDQHESASKGYQDANLLIDNITLVPDNFSEQDCEGFPGIEPEDGATSVDVKVSKEPNLLEGGNGDVEILELTSGSEESDGSLEDEEDEEDEEDYPSDGEEDEEVEDEEIYMEEGHIRYMTDEKRLIHKYGKDEESFEDEEEEDMYDSERDGQTSLGQNSSVLGTERENETVKNVVDGTMLVYSENKGKGEIGVEQTLVETQNDQAVVNKPIKPMMEEMEVAVTPHTEVAINHTSLVDKTENKREVKEINNKPDKTTDSSKDIESESETLVKSTKETFHYLTNDSVNNDEKTKVFDGPKTVKSKTSTEGIFIDREYATLLDIKESDIKNSERTPRLVNTTPQLTQPIRREEVEAKLGTAFEKEDSSETSKSLTHVEHTKVGLRTSVESREDLDTQTRSESELEGVKVEQEANPQIEMETKTCENVPVEPTISNGSDDTKCTEAESRTEIVSENSTSELEPCLVTERAKSEPMEIDNVETACTDKRIITAEEETEVKTENQDVGDDGGQDVKEDISLKDSQSQDVGGRKDVQEQAVSAPPSDRSDSVTKEKEHSVSEECVEKLLVISGEVDCQHVLDEGEDKTETTYSTCNGPVVDMDIAGLGADQGAEDRGQTTGQSRKRRRVSTPLPEIDTKRWRMEYWCIWGLPVDQGQEDSLMGWQRVLADLVRYTLQKSTVVSDEETTAQEKLDRLVGLRCWDAYSTSIPTRKERKLLIKTITVILAFEEHVGCHRMVRTRNKDGRGKDSKMIIYKDMKYSSPMASLVLSDSLLLAVNF